MWNLEFFCDNSYLTVPNLSESVKKGKHVPKNVLNVSVLYVTKKRAKKSVLKISFCYFIFSLKNQKIQFCFEINI